MIGVAAGLVGAAVFTRLLQALLYQVRTVEPVVFAGVSLAFVLVGVGTALLPAWRALRIDPIRVCGADAGGGRAPGPRCASIIARRLAISLSRAVHVHI